MTLIFGFNADVGTSSCLTASRCSKLYLGGGPTSEATSIVRVASTANGWSNTKAMQAPAGNNNGTLSNDDFLFILFERVPQAADQLSARRSRTRPSCATDATSVPSREKISPREKPRAPAMLGESCA